MISISLSTKFCCQDFIMSIKVIDMTGHSSKSNKLRNINTIGCRTRKGWSGDAMVLSKLPSSAGASYNVDYSRARAWQ